MINPGNGRYLADHIPNAKYVEVRGSDHTILFRNQDHILGAATWVLEQEAPDLEEDRFLSTVLVVRSDQEVDDDTWRDRVRRFRGQAVPGKQHAYFDGPIRALRCGAAIAKACGASLGVHTGQVVRQGAAASGTAFDVAEAIAAQAPPGQAWASRVLVDLVPGSDLGFSETGVAVPVQDREIALLSVRAHS
jgi:hypothetical protein